jgi:hypothetical protein
MSINSEMNNEYMNELEFIEETEEVTDDEETEDEFLQMLEDEMEEEIIITRRG